MGKIITHCPSCDSHALNVVKIECLGCQTTFEGQFEISALMKLPEEDLRFILDFVCCSGSLKEMAQKQQMSYPTLRNRLNALIDTLEKLGHVQDSSKDEILLRLESGEISAKEAAELLKRL
ncbi:MAG: DUF2089 family protein [Gammaproteobacteria bacterium]|nr:DUF2089 family protein [Gammaproteobacteria bacterium]